jgi:hypothetical protein
MLAVMKPAGRLLARSSNDATRARSSMQKMEAAAAASRRSPIGAYLRFFAKN